MFRYLFIQIIKSNYISYIIYKNYGLFLMFQQMAKKYNVKLQQLRYNKYKYKSITIYSKANMVMFIKYASLLMAILSILFQQTLQYYCLTNCTYDLDTSGAANYNGQCSMLDPSSCTACDSRFSFLVGTQCKLYPHGIYNTTFVIEAKDWEPMSVTVPYYTALSAPLMNDWRQFLDAATVTYLKAMTVPYYGIRCRTLFHMSTVQFYPTVYLYVNTTIYGEGIQIRPVLDEHYNQQQWIHTSKFIQISDQSLLFRLIFSLPTPVNTAGGNHFAFRQTTCMVAYCVAGCASCTNLNDCSACVTGYYLDVVLKHCNSNMCPAGQYIEVNAATRNNEGVCKLCDPLCDQCTGSSTNCLNCVDHGPYQSYLYQSRCYVTCPNSFIPNEHNHTCDCPSGYYVATGGVCTLCNAACLNCTAGGSSNCIACSQGYFLQAVATTTCSLTCPAGQYSSCVDDINKCYLCDSTACVTCANSSTMCTSCNFASKNRWLFNYACMYLCPDGYEGNNVTFICDQCMLGMYSYNNICYYECPLYYVPDNAIRACVLPGGYPLNMTVSVQNSYTLKFTIPLPLGLDSTLLTMLKTNWQSYISLMSITEDKNILIFNQQRRLLQTVSKLMSISNAIIQNNSIILYSTSLNAQELAHTHSFTARFKDNLFSPQNVIYSITSKNTTDSFPYVVNQYFNQNSKPLYLIGIFLALLALVVVLMRIKYVYRVMIEYIHCIQLIGLTLFAIYPHSAQLNLYSFLVGFDYANFSFMYNIPQKLITPCYDCVCLISFSFAVGDMNWLRMMGALLLCAIIMFLLCLIIYVFQCSRKYAKFFVLLVIDLILVKTVHGWFASLVYAGLNLTYNLQNFDIYILGVHLLSYLLLVPVIFARAKAQNHNKYVNISFVFLIIFIILLVLLSLGPTLICALLILINVTEWGIVIGLGVKQQHPQQLQSKIQSSHFSYKFHMHLLRCMKPITAFLVACIIMIQNQIVPIALVSTIFCIFLIMIVLDAFFQYTYQDKFAKITKLNNKSQSVNDTKQDFKQNDTQYKQNPGVLIFDENQIDNNFNDEIDNDDIVGKKFRRNKHTINSQKGKSSQLVKNVQ